MIVFKSISWRNFLSTGDSPNKIILNESPSTLIVGTNGAGKSTLVDALSFALFGKPHRDITKPQLLNSINLKNCVVEVEFQIGSSNFQVIRGMKPTIFEIWQDGQLINQESHARDYQKILETNILKLNHNSFHQIVVLGSSSFVPFMQMPIWDRRKVIEDLLDISIFTKMNVVLKEKLSKMKDSLKDTEHHLELAREKILLQNKHLDGLKQIDQENIASLQGDINRLHEEVANKRIELEKLEKQYSSTFKKVQKNLDQANITQQQLEGFGRQIVENKKVLESDVEFYSKNDSCPTCLQTISLDFKKDKISHGISRIKEVDQGLKELIEAERKHAAELQSAQEEAGKVKKLHISSVVTQASIDALNLQIETLMGKMSNSKTIDTSEATQELSNLRDERDRLQELRADQMDVRTYQEIALEMLKDTGIKTKIIRQYIPLMNKYINSYLNVLDFFVSFTLDESFSEKIRSRHRDDFSYASFSEGEKMRINLSILFAWRQIAKIKNSTNTNLLVLDETFDSSLDGDGVDNLIKILNTLTNTNVFIITHKPDVMADKVASRIEFAKVGNFSQVKQ